MTGVQTCALPIYGLVLKLISIGSCSFTIFTNETKDYLYFKSDQVKDVSAARTKLVYNVGIIPTQSSKNLPLNIEGPFVYGPLGLVIPTSKTPEVCVPINSYIRVTSGGTCTLLYSSIEDANYLASDIFTLSFEISRSNQTIQFELPSSIDLASKKIGRAHV